MVRSTHYLNLKCSCMQSKTFQDFKWQTEDRKCYNVSCLCRKISYIPANILFIFIKGYCHETALEQSCFTQQSFLLLISKTRALIQLSSSLCHSCPVRKFQPVLLDKSSVGNDKSSNVKDILHLSHSYLMMFLLPVVKLSPTQSKKVCLRNFFEVIQMKQIRIKEI